MRRGICLLLPAAAACAASAVLPEAPLALRCAADEIKIAWGETGASDHVQAVARARSEIFVAKSQGEHRRMKGAAQGLAQKTRKSGRISDAGACDALLSAEDRSDIENRIVENIAEIPDPPQI